MYEIRTINGREAVILMSAGRLLPEAADHPLRAAYSAWLALGNEPMRTPPPPPTADAVRAEAQRRMMRAIGARDAGHLDVLISNGTREAVRLLRIKADRAWTEQETARAAVLEATDNAIDAIRTASNAMEPSPPADYADNAHWPAVGAAGG